MGTYYTVVYKNTGEYIDPYTPQALVSGALHGTWGAFDQTDLYEDLAVTDGTQIRVYMNAQDGTLNPQPLTFTSTQDFDYNALQIALVQMNGPYHIVSANKLDVVGFSGSLVKVWQNDNNNSIPGEPQSVLVGVNVSSFAVAPLDNDNYNDVIAGYGFGGSGAVKLFRNNGSGYLDTNPIWTFSQDVGSGPRVALGDLGSVGDPGRNDGLFDLVIVTGSTARVFINRGTGYVFDPLPDQTVNLMPQKGSVPGESGQTILADLQTNGGLSLLYTIDPTGEIRFLRHNGDPAPAPPKGLQMTTFTDELGYRYPRLLWRPNIERDLNAYEIWRKVTGICGNANWYLISTVGSSAQEYTDWSISTVGYGSDCSAEYRLRAVDTADHPSNYSSTVSVLFSSLNWKLSDPSTLRLPTIHALHQAHPNPFNPTTQIKFDLPEPAAVSLVIYDVLGREVTTLARGQYEAGYYSAAWNASNVASGIYFARFSARSQSGEIKLAKVSKLVLAK